MDNDYKLTLNDISPYMRNIKYRGNEIISACPICESDDNKGHHLYCKNDNNALVLYCQKCNSSGTEIIKRFRELGAKHKTLMSQEKKSKVVIEDYDHVYKKPNGDIAYYKHRKKYNDGSKQFSFRYYDEKGNVCYTKPNGCNVLYNLDLLEVASKQKNIPRLYICEGEKNADILIEAGLLATTSNTGAQKNIKFTDVDLEMLSRFPDKIVLNDNDSKGEEYVEAWQELGADWLPITELWVDAPPKADIYDYILNGGDIVKLIEWKSFKLENINDIDGKELVSDDFLKRLYRIKDKVERTKALIVCEQRASDCGIGRKNFKDLWKAFLAKQTNGKGFNGNRTNFQGAPVGQLDCADWIADMTGVYRLVKNENDELENEYASMIPIVPSAILENQEDGTEKIAVSFYKKLSWRTVNIPKEVLVNSNKIIELATIGADVSSLTAKLLVKYFSDIINLNEGKALPTLKTVSHLGWYGEEFVPYSDKIETDLERDFTSVINAMESKGTLEEWVEFIKPLRVNKHLRLVLDASFASVLVEKVNGLSFFLHLYGSTGFGKTLSLMLAASVWGNPGKGGLVFPLNSTLNYIARLAGVLKNIPLCGDELQMIKTAYGNYDRLIMTLAEGEEKGRLSKDIIARKKGAWDLCVLTTGEEPIVKYESGGGAINRVIEVYCDKPITDNGPEVASFITEHYGVAGRKFIECLPSNKEIKATFKWLQESFSQVDTTSKQIMAMSLLALADCLTCEFIFHDDMLSTEDFASFLKSENEVDASERAYEALQALIVENRANFNFDTESVTESNKLWGCFTNNEICFVAGILKKEFAKLGYQFDDYKQKWNEKGYIQRFGVRYDTPKRIMRGNKQVRCIVINRADWV